eukprot:TRINITY_DN38761_c0_g1_i1.p1 TRINITY_DN38761_c0_g1~~TRINITY_DN38761_c0_g1_i1.p1  ORF type:complete len:67 (+),score=7.15 TRINITY_DN38761_c0_g1_i1:54-254(+)
MRPNGRPVPTVLLANKCDMNYAMSPSDIDKFAKDYGFIGWFPTSARTGQGINEAQWKTCPYCLTRK